MQPSEELIKLHRLLVRFLKVHAFQAVNVTKFEPFILIYDVEERNEPRELDIAFVTGLRFLWNQGVRVLANCIESQIGNALPIWR